MDALLTARTAADRVRAERRPAVLHLETVRFMGHAGSDVEQAYRTRAEIAADHARDPLWSAAQLLLETSALTVEEVRERYEATRAEVMGEARSLCGSKRLDSAAAVMEPLVRSRPEAVRAAVRRRPPGNPDLRPDGDGTARTLAQAINATLSEVLALHPEAPGLR